MVLTTSTRTPKRFYPFRGERWQLALALEGHLRNHAALRTKAVRRMNSNPLLQHWVLLVACSPLPNGWCMPYTSEFTYEMNIWIHEDMNSDIWIQMYGSWIHIWIDKYIISDIIIHCVQSEFMNQIFYEFIIWIHYENLWEFNVLNSWIMILNSVVKYGIWIYCKSKES